MARNAQHCHCGVPSSLPFQQAQAVGSETKAESGQVPAELVAGCWRGAETAKREERLLEESKDLAKNRAVRDVRRVTGPSSAPGAAVSEQLLPEAVKPEEFLRPLPAQAPICGAVTNSRASVRNV